MREISISSFDIEFFDLSARKAIACSSSCTSNFPAVNASLRRFGHDMEAQFTAKVDTRLIKFFAKDGVLNVVQVVSLTTNLDKLGYPIQY